MPSTHLATFDGLVKRYGETTAVEGLSLAVPEGTVCGLLGPNGAGKTTAIRVLLGLAKPTAGSTTLLGEQPGSPGFAAAVRKVGTLIEGRPSTPARPRARTCRSRRRRAGCATPAARSTSCSRSSASPRAPTRAPARSRWA